MNLAIAIVSVVAAIAATLAAIRSLFAARRANEAATTLATIERERRHEELTPRFEFAFTENPNTDTDAELGITLTGGPTQLDCVTVRILDESGVDHWRGGLPQHLTLADADMFVWGPWEFNALAAVQIANRRTSRSEAYSRISGRDWARLPLKPTMAGPWMSDSTTASWRQDHPGPLRLQLTCTREGDDPWVVTYEVPV